ncbi:MAG: lytic transglycosylase domain-containing protein [Tissierellia bacterium]|nr:lytic transglycosylase domain-containing protein [Tissierellia bacterium]
MSYRNSINIYSKQFNVDPYLVAAIINVESSYDKTAISNKEARGLMQISPTTGQWAAEDLSIEDFSLDLLFEPEINIMIGTWYLNMLSDEFDHNIQLILAAYNGGSGNVRKWLENDEYCEDGIYLKKIPFKETRDYVEKVLKNYKVYKILYRDEFDRLSTKEESYFIVMIHNFKKIVKGLLIYK